MEESTPIFDALWEKYHGTPIFDQLSKKYEEKRKEEELDILFPDTPAEQLDEELRQRREDWVRAVLEAERKRPFFKAYTGPILASRYFLQREPRPINKENQLMKKNWQELVNEFRYAMNLPVADGPRMLTTAEQELHIKLIREEFEKELVPAIMANDLVEIYDAGIDVMYYLIGLLSNAGMQIDPGFREVHGSNMSKLDPETGMAIKAGPNDPTGAPEGKVLKGPDFFVPNLANILNDQSKYGHEDTAVYKDLRVPLRLGFGGPKIGEGRVHMDNQGDIMFEGVMDDVSILPVINHLGLDVSAISINEDDKPAAGWDVADLDFNRFATPRYSKSYESGVSADGGPIVFNQFVQTPTDKTPADIYRETEEALKRAPHE